FASMQSEKMRECVELKLRVNEYRSQLEALCRVYPELRSRYRFKPPEPLPSVSELLGTPTVRVDYSDGSEFRERDEVDDGKRCPECQASYVPERDQTLMMCEKCNALICLLCFAKMSQHDASCPTLQKWE